MTHYAITATKHKRRRDDDNRRGYARHWELVSSTGGVIAAYDKPDYLHAIFDAATLRNGCATVCDVRKAI